MVVKHRKLFPSQTDQTNQTAECLEFCDPDCPYPCYPDPLLYLSPPPPPPPLPPPAAAKHIPPYVIIVASLLVTFVLLLGYYFIIAKYCAIWHRSSSAAPPPSRHDEEEEEEEEIPMAVAAVDHPIWYIATVGLQQAIVNSITACKYKKGEGLIEGTECSVCLNEFREGETLRLLPKCSHAFHIPCIDTWLRSRTNCPLCRAPIVSNATATNHDSRDSAQIEETQRGDFGGYGDQERSSVVSENRGRTEEVNGQRAEEEDVANESKQGNFSSNLDDLKQVKRSFSMDYASNQRVEAPKSDLGEVNLSMRREMGSSSMAEPVREKPVSMKRSLSCGGGPHVFFPET